MAVLEAPIERAHLVEGYPAPIPGRVEPFGFVRAIKRHLANKEDTEIVFEIMRTLLGKSHERGFTRFVSTPVGRQVISERRDLFDTLKNRAALAAMPKGSFGRAYFDFFLEEGLMIEMLEQASRELDRKADQDPAKYPEFMRYVHRMRYCHDLWHILTGYGRDGLGESCNVAFSYSQTKIKGFAAIALFTAIKWKKEAPQYPIFAAVKQAFDIGARAEWFLGEDIEALLPMNLEEVRAKLKIAPPDLYFSIPGEIRDSFGKPEDDMRADNDPAKDRAA